MPLLLQRPSWVVPRTLPLQPLPFHLPFQRPSWVALRLLPLQHLQFPLPFQQPSWVAPRALPLQHLPFPLPFQRPSWVAPRALPLQPLPLPLPLQQPSWVAPRPLPLHIRLHLHRPPRRSRRPPHRALHLQRPSEAAALRHLPLWPSPVWRPSCWIPTRPLLWQWVCRGRTTPLPFVSATVCSPVLGLQRVAALPLLMESHRQRCPSLPLVW